MADDQNKTNDFFKLLEKDQKIENPFATDEILFRDENGQIKVLKGTEVIDFNQSSLPAKKKEVAGPVISKVTAVAPAVAVKVKTSPLPVAKPMDLTPKVKEIIKKTGVHFTDDQTANRFSNIIRSCLRGVRNQVQLREVLLSSPSVGGMGFTAEEVDRILKIIGEECERLDGKLREKLSQEPFSDLKSEAQKILAESLPIPTDVVFTPKTVRTAEKKKEVSVKFQPAAPVSFQPQRQLKPEPVTISRPIISSATARPKIEDVKFRPKLTGPIEEIRSMTLTDFRRLAPNPQQAIEKILEKIGLLEEESFTKKTEAIKAWKENDVYRLYLQLGDQSMELKKPIAEVISQKKQTNQPTLTEEEIEAIIELNQKLRY